MDTKTLLDAAINKALPALSAQVGVSAPLLARRVLQLIDQPEVIAAHPIECRILRDRRQQRRDTRSARTLHTPLV